MVTAEAQSMAVRARGRGYELQLDVDDARNHPLSIFRQCWSAYAKAQEGLRHDKSAQWRNPGERVQLSAVVKPWTGLQLAKRRYPKGFQAALVFTDHADQSSAARLAALMFGEGRDKPPHAPKQPRRGFATHGLGMSKSVYARGGAFKQLDGPDYRVLVHRLLRETQGRIEIGPHSTSGRRESRLSALKDLRDFQSLDARFWIDHQPSTNCEAITNQGADETTIYHITDVLGHYGYDYVWSGLDRRQSKGSLNLFQPKRSAQHQPILFQHSRVDGKRRGLWLFSSVWAAHDFSEFLRRYGPKRLEALEEEHGIHIAHTYLDTYLTGGAMKNWTLLQRVPGGFRLQDKAERLFRGLAARQARGDLWVAGIVAVGDHLIGMADVRIDSMADGSFLLHHRGDRNLSGATFSISRQAGRPYMNDRPLPQTQSRTTPQDNQRWFWFDLEAGQTVRLHFPEAGAVPRPATAQGSRLLWTEPPTGLLRGP